GEVRIIDCGSFLGALDQNCQKETARVPTRSDETPVDAFMATWNSSRDEYRDPPEYIVARDGEDLILCIATEYWTRIGGPRPYHDSYTYSIYSRDNIIENVIKFLVTSDAAREWEISLEPIRLSDESQTRQGPLAAMVRAFKDWL
ncbi:MAG TPA: hypothetical protein VF122_00855, partial [Caulobacteraceae bacterium]